MFAHEVVRGASAAMWPFAAPCKMSGRCVIDDDRASTTCRPSAKEEGGRLAPDWEKGDGEGH